MNIRPIPNELLGDKIVLITPSVRGFTETPIENVRVERNEKTVNGTFCRAEITVWADCQNSTRAEFLVGEKVRYNGEMFEITEQKIYRADKPHHCKFKASKIGDDGI